MLESRVSGHKAGISRPKRSAEAEGTIDSTTAQVTAGLHHSPGATRLFIAAEHAVTSHGPHLLLQLHHCPARPVLAVSEDAWGKNATALSVPFHPDISLLDLEMSVLDG